VFLRSGLYGTLQRVIWSSYTKQGASCLVATLCVVGVLVS
jgi:hypothetical protein